VVNSYFNLQVRASYSRKHFLD